MPRPCYSTVFEQSADRVWSAIRDFGNYGWAGVVSETHIEDGKSGDSVGCIRNVRTNGNTLYTYAFSGQPPFPLRNYVATLRITPIIDGDRSFVEWSAAFDCTDNEHDHWTAHFTTSFRKWLEALRCHLVA
jgi:hypothetical protein